MSDTVELMSVNYSKFMIGSQNGGLVDGPISPSAVLVCHLSFLPSFLYSMLDKTS